MTEKDKQLLNSCISRRESGKYLEIIEDLNTLLKKYPQNTTVIIEILKLCVLLGEFERAYQFYQKLLKLTNGQINDGAEVLLRLQIGLHGMPLPGLNTLNLEKNAGWCHNFMKTRIDSSVEFKIDDVSVVCSDGTVNYAFSGSCGSCGHPARVELYRTFLVRREFLCPVCFAKLLFAYEGIKDFLQANYRHMMDEQAYALDDRFRKIQYELNVDAAKGGVAYSKISKYLNQDYIFILNQFLLTRQMAKR